MIVGYLSRLKLLRRFGRARRGMAAVEFGLIAAPFFLLIVGLAEVAMIGMAQSSLDFSVSESGRQIRTGRAQSGGVTEAEVKDQICENLNSFLVITCEDRLYLDVRRFDSFVDADIPNPIADGEFSNDGMGYAPGGASDIVVVRAYYRWEILTPLFEPILQNVDDGDRILASTMMFRNEPF